MDSLSVTPGNQLLQEFDHSYSIMSSPPLAGSEGIADQLTQSPVDPMSPALPPIRFLSAGESSRVLVTEAGFGSNDTDSSFSPQPTSAAHLSDGPGSYGDLDAEQRREIAIDAARLDPDYAKHILSRLPVRTEGWCELVQLRPTKPGGYIQLSVAGVNKFALLQSVVLWADGKDLTKKGDQCSHRCHNPPCRVVGHIIPESAVENNARKGCLVWINCHHCSKKIFVCMHEPCCIKFCEGFRDTEHLLAEGVCRRLLNVLCE
jgi:hypothetical protein